MLDFKYILLLIVFVVFGTTNPVLAINDFDNSTRTEKIKIGYYENEKFQEGASEGAIKLGFSYEYLQKISSITGWKYEYVYGSWTELYDSFIKGDIDLLAGLGYSENRLEFMNYPDYPMGFETYYLYINDQDQSITHDPKSLSGKKIGTIPGLLESSIREWIIERNVSAEIVLFDDINDRDNALLKGEIDAFIGESASVTAKKNIIPFFKIKNINMYLCVAKRRTDLLTELNDALSELDSKEPYYINELSKKYFSNSALSLHITHEEEKWLEAHNYTIDVGYLDNFLPYSSSDENGNAIGIIVDVLTTGFGKLNTKKPVQFKFKAYGSTQEMLDAIHKHQIEIMFPLSDEINIVDEYNIYNSNEVVSSAMYLVYKDNLSKSMSGKIAVNKNNFTQTNYATRYFSNNQKVYFNSVEECLNAVVNGDADATILSGLRASTKLKSADYDELSYLELPHNSVKEFGVSSTHRGILALVNQALNSLDDNVALSQINKYIGQTLDYSVKEFLKKNILIVSFCICLILSIAVFLVLFITFKHRKQQLYFEFAYKDGLTKLFNRRAYEEEMEKYSSAIPDNLICVSMDLTGLKRANDTFGHLAGDELIQESARLLSFCFDKFGKIYRTGGDEFYAILFMSIQKFEEIKSKFQEQCRNWKGKHSDILNIAMGYATPKDVDNNSIIVIGKIADQRMYDNKSNWYKSQGVDRRGRTVAYLRICQQYTKILKINLTNDSFSVVNMFANENTEDKGYSEKISEWLSNFAKLGNVHPEDLDKYLKLTDISYLRDYFKKGNKSLWISYRRKYHGEYHQVYMELMLADDYEEDNQTLFLCVKQISNEN